MRSLVLVDMSRMQIDLMFAALFTLSLFALLLYFTVLLLFPPYFQVAGLANRAGQRAPL